MKQTKDTRTYALPRFSNNFGAKLLLLALVFAVSGIAGLPAASAATTTKSVKKMYLRNNNTETAFTYKYVITDDVLTNKYFSCDWDGNGTDTANAYSSTGSNFLLRSQNADGEYAQTVLYGLGTDTPVCGDWAAAGHDSIGVYRSRNGTFYLRNTVSQGVADKQVKITGTLASDVPVVGDWDGNGTDTVGVYRTSKKTFYLRNSNTSGAPDVTVVFGNVHDQPVVGDWDGNGTDTVGVYRPATATFYLKGANSTNPGFDVVPYGTKGSSPLVGDWDGDHKTTVGVVAAETVKVTTPAQATTPPATTKPVTTKPLNVPVLRLNSSTKAGYSLAWNKPALPSGVTPTLFTYSYKADGVLVKSQAVSSQTYSVALPLQCGHKYTFDLATVYSNGQAASSKTLARATPACPAPHARVVSRGANSYALRWTKPILKSGVSLTSYSYTYSYVPAGQQAPVTAGNSLASTINEDLLTLKCGQRYTFTVKANYSDGTFGTSAPITYRTKVCS